MRCCINYCWICRYLPPFFRCAKSWRLGCNKSNQQFLPTPNLHPHGVGLLAGLVDSNSRS